MIVGSEILQHIAVSPMWLPDSVDWILGFLIW